MSACPLWISPSGGGKRNSLMTHGGDLKTLWGSMATEFVRQAATAWVSDCDRLMPWLALADSGWLAMASSVGSWLVMAVLRPGRLWLASACSCWLRLALAGCGGHWLALAGSGCGWLWPALAGSGWLRQVGQLHSVY